MLLQIPTCFYCFGGFVSKHWQLRRLRGLYGPRRSRDGSSRHHAAPLAAPCQPDQPVVRGGWAGGTCKKKKRREWSLCFFAHLFIQKQAAGKHRNVHHMALIYCSYNNLREETILHPHWMWSQRIISISTHLWITSLCWNHEDECFCDSRKRRPLLFATTIGNLNLLAKKSKVRDYNENAHWCCYSNNSGGCDRGRQRKTRFLQATVLIMMVWGVMTRLLSLHYFHIL